MLKQVKEDKKLILYWLTRAEYADQDLINSIHKEAKRNKNVGYVTAIFISGTEDLKETVLELLRVNRRKMAKAEIKKEKECLTK